METDGKDALSNRSQVPERERRDQRTFLRQMERSLPRSAARVSRWAGRMTPEDWQALTTYAPPALRPGTKRRLILAQQPQTEGNPDQQH